MARNLSWIDRKRLGELLDGAGPAPAGDEETLDQNAFLDDELESRFSERPRPPRSRFQEPIHAPAFDDEVPVPPMFPVLEELTASDDLGTQDLDRFSDALDRMDFESFATSGPSSFDLPPSTTPEPQIVNLIEATPVIDDTAQFSPFDMNSSAPMPNPLPVDDETDPVAALALAFPEPPPSPEPIEEVALPAHPSIDPSFAETYLDAYDNSYAELTAPTGDSFDDDDGFGPPVSNELSMAYAPPPLHLSTAPVPPVVEDEAIELTCERFFDWALDFSGLDGVLVVDHRGLLVAERGIHELQPALLIDTLPVARGLQRYHGSNERGHLALRHGRLHVVVLWSRAGGDRPLFAGLSGLAAPTQDLTPLQAGFAQLFGESP